MAKRIIAVNAGPRKGWNTETLISEASKGAESAGAVVERFDLFRLEKYTGCISCFGCKKNKFKKNRQGFSVIQLPRGIAPFYLLARTNVCKHVFGVIY